MKPTGAAELKPGPDLSWKHLLLLLFVAYTSGIGTATVFGPNQGRLACAGYMAHGATTEASARAGSPAVVAGAAQEAADRPLAVEDPFAGKHTDSMELAPYSPAADRNLVFRALLDYIQAAGVEGDYVETGVWQGASASVVATQLVCSKHTPQMKAWLYDAWQGMPETRPEDGTRAAQTVGWGKDGNLPLVLENLKKTGINIEEGVVIRKGWFNETFALEKPEKVAFLHVDSDWYSSVMDTLIAFYDRVPMGGVVVFDDFGFWEGCRRAFYDFFEARHERPLLERNGVTQAWFIKGREHNRHDNGHLHSLNSKNPAC